MYSSTDRPSQAVSPAYSNSSVRLSRPGAGFFLAVIALFILASLAFFIAYTSQRDAVADFFIEWRGSQVALQGGNPYSPETTRSIQLGSKGRELGPDEDQLAFVYPYWRVFYSAPIAFLPYAWASAIWLGFLLAAYVASLYLLTLAIGWKPTTPLKSVTFYCTLILMFPAFSALMLGQSALLGAALLGLAYYFLKDNKPGWAGFVLALATVKPQLTLVIIPWLLLRALWRREWRFLAGFGFTLSGLALLSFAFYPDWFGQFVTVAGRYPAYKKSLTGPGFLLDWLGGAATVPTAISWLVLAGIGLWFWLKEGRQGGSGRLFDLAYSLALTLTLLLPPQTNISNPVILALPLTLLFASWDKRGPYFWLAGGVLIGSWLLYFVFYNNFYGLVIVAWPFAITFLLWLNFKAEIKPLLGWFNKPYREEGGRK